jgi:hypothetical protein
MNFLAGILYGLLVIAVEVYVFDIIDKEDPGDFKEY